jgi:hypothetical protein
MTDARQSSRVLRRRIDLIMGHEIKISQRLQGIEGLVLMKDLPKMNSQSNSTVMLILVALVRMFLLLTPRTSM